MSRLSRRTFLAAGAAAFATPLEALRLRLDAGLPIRDTLGYGALAPVKDATTGLPLLELPEGFRYLTFGWFGDPMSNERPTPPLHDGMAAFAGPDRRVILVRNHEATAGSAFGDVAYDPRAGGGTTTIVFDPAEERVVSMLPSLAGTVRNCAGGPTPWGSWLTCEESVLAPGQPKATERNPNPPPNPITKQHGYIFEVPSAGVATAEPLKAMGCFVHEAIAVDPETGIVYETEDQSQAGLYRFVPRTPGSLAEGGKLQMLAIDGRNRFSTSKRQSSGVTYRVHWVDIPEPDKPHSSPDLPDARGVRMQGYERGAALFSRLEGACFSGGKLYVTATDGGDALMGQVWELDPKENRLRLVFESTGPGVLNMPDNICMSPRGGIVVCEDGTANPCIHGLTRDGRIFRFARNAAKLAGERNTLAGDFSKSELAGATFSPDGTWLFFNMQSPGITFAVTGPWADGGL